jgi:hypothetical protein
MPGTLLAPDRHAQPGAADQQCPIGFAVGHHSRSGDGDVRAGGVLVGSDADVDDGGDVRVGIQVAAQDVLVLQAGIIAADHYS